MTYYWFYKKAKERHSKEKAAEYYLKDKESKKNVKELIQKLVKKRKMARLKSTKEKDNSNWSSTKKDNN